MSQIKCMHRESKMRFLWMLNLLTQIFHNFLILGIQNLKVRLILNLSKIIWNKVTQHNFPQDPLK